MFGLAWESQHCSLLQEGDAVDDENAVAPQDETIPTRVLDTRMIPLDQLAADPEVRQMVRCTA
jgi:hypothetical protein